MSKKIIRSHQAPAPLGPYNQAVMAGNTLYVSGQIAIDQTTGNMINQDIVAETHQVMKNLGFVLDAANMTFDSVVKCTIFVQNLDHFKTMNEVYGSYFDEDTAPARETVEVARLPKDVHIEISCIAIK